MKALKDAAYRHEYKGYVITQTWKDMSLECSRVWRSNKHRITFWGLDSTDKAKEWIDSQIATSQI